MWEADEQKNQINGLEYAAIFPGYYYGPFEVLKISVSTQLPGFKCPFWQFSLRGRLMSKFPQK
jgi:hypothetical protein